MKRLLFAGLVAILSASTLQAQVLQPDTAQDTGQGTNGQMPRDTGQQMQDTVPQPDQTPAPRDTMGNGSPDQEQDGRLRQSGDERMEVGLMVGEPTGISYKFWVTDRNALDAALAVSYVPDAVLQLHADYLRHDFDFANVGQGRMPIVYGLGMAVQFQDETTLGIRVPLGLTYLFSDLPLSLFIDVAPRIDVAPETDVSINASLGARYRFF